MVEPLRGGRREKRQWGGWQAVEPLWGGRTEKGEWGTASGRAVVGRQEGEGGVRQEQGMGGMASGRAAAGWEERVQSFSCLLQVIQQINEENTIVRNHIA